jgi:hypothetical protein
MEFPFRHPIKPESNQQNNNADNPYSWPLRSHHVIVGLHLRAEGRFPSQVESPRRGRGNVLVFSMNVRTLDASHWAHGFTPQRASLR